MRRSLIISVAFGAAVACGRGAPDDQRARADSTLAQGGVIDSALPIPVLLDRFRAAIADTPTVLTGGETSPERISRALLRAIEERDTAVVRSLLMTRAEFAWLFYPHTKFTAPPYELDPGIVWMQLRGASETGMTRLFNRLGGTKLRFVRVSCPDSLTTEGPNSFVNGCMVRFAPADSAARDLRLFGALLKRDGRYKFVSYANDL